MKSAFLVFSDDWGGHPSSAQHLFGRIAVLNDVYWVNTIGMRDPTFSLTDVRKIVAKLSNTGVKSYLPNLGGQRAQPRVVCRPLMVPYSRFRIVRNFNSRSVERCINRTLKGALASQPVLVTTVPNVGDYARLCRNCKVVYYCVDDFRFWPGVNAEVVRQMESSLIKRADVLIGVSDALCSRLSESGKHVHKLTHGVDEKFFHLAGEAEHPRLRDIPHPRAGFIGLLDGRVDVELLKSVSELLGEWSFVIVGPSDSSIGKMRFGRNVYRVGRVPYAEVSQIMAGFDVLLLPYRSGGELAKSLSPLKLKEYLATGLPVVSTSIDQVREYESFVHISDSARQWSHALEEALSEELSLRRQRIHELLKSESWGKKAEEFLNICVSEGVL